MARFILSEQYIVNLFPQNYLFVYNGQQFRVLFAGKPSCRSGEPKTDIFVRAARCIDNQIWDIKISYKQENANFIENKMTAERAEQIFGRAWSDIICGSIANIEDVFAARKLIYKIASRKTQAGSFTLGWRFELLNVKSGELSDEMQLSQQQVYEVYSGAGSTEDKINAFVCGQRINDSGIADFILMQNALDSGQAVIDSMVQIAQYIAVNPSLFFSCKAVNYRSLHIPPKWEGNRSLSVYVDWDISGNKLAYRLRLDNPLELTGNEIGGQLLTVLNRLGIRNSNDISPDNVEDYSIVLE